MTVTCTRQMAVKVGKSGQILRNSWDIELTGLSDYLKQEDMREGNVKDDSDFWKK